MRALLAFYEERYDEALTQLDLIGERLPWFYEAPKLRGDIFHVRALVRWGDGPRTEDEDARIQADLDAARQAYTRAADTAQSAPEVHCGLARVEWAAVSMQLYGRGEVMPHIERALEHLSRALQVAPDHAPSWVLRATLYRRLARSRSLQGSAAEEPLQQAIESATKALQLAPSSLEARKELGMDWLELSTHQLEKSLDPRDSLRRASETLEAITPTQRDYYVHHGLGLIFTRWADYEESHGADPLLNRDKAIEALRKSLELEENYEAGWVNLASQYYKRAALPRSPSMEEDLERAWQAVEKGRALSRQNTEAQFQAGRIQLLRAQRLRDTGADERPALAAALNACREGLKLNPQMARLQNLAGLVLMEQARGAKDRGEAFLPLLDQAEQFFEQVRAAAPQQHWAYNNLADLHATRAVYLHAAAQEGVPSARAALRASQEAQQRAPTHPFPLINLGHASQLLATFALEAQRDPSPHVAEATQQLQQALDQLPKNGEARLYLAEARAVQARWHARQGRGQDKDFEEAAERPLDYRLAFGRFCREWAAWRQQAGLDPAPPLERGLELAEAVLASRPAWSEAQALSTSLQRLRPDGASQ
jgi:serine/threonine-protein kinase